VYALRRQRPEEIVSFFSTHSLTPAEEANKMFQHLSQSQTNGCAVFQVSYPDNNVEMFNGDETT